jgi:hypothetical protein
MDLARHHLIAARSLQRPREGFSQRHGFSMHYRSIFPPMLQAKLALLSFLAKLEASSKIGRTPLSFASALLPVQLTQSPS